MLGTGGWIPTPRRETTCAIVSLPEALLIFDAGTGLSRLLEERFRPELKTEREVHLFLSHYHLDHCAGLVYLPAMLRGKTVHLHAPTEDITGSDPEETLTRLVSKPFNPQSLFEMPAAISLEPLSEGEHEIAGLTIRVRGQLHPDRSVAYRLGDLLVFATDTRKDTGNIEFSRGAALLVHEAWIDGKEEEDPKMATVIKETYAGHSSARQCAELARGAGVDQLALCHLNPLRSDAYHERMLESARSIFPRTRIFDDGEMVPLAELREENKRD
jgi:ribonuclease BN (tRNA processing enzyme)